MTESHSFIHELLISVYRRLNSAVASVIRRYRLSKRIVASKKRAISKDTNGYETVVQPILESNISNLEQLADETGVDLSTVWQAALALTLHYYNPSEVLTFAYEDDSPDSGKKPNMCTLRVEPIETTIDILRRLSSSRSMQANNISSDHQVAWNYLGDPGAPSCKVAIQIQRSGRNLNASSIYRKSDLLFKITATESGSLKACLDYSTSNLSESLAWSMIYTFDLVLRGMRKLAWVSIEELDICSQYDRRLIRKFTSSVSQAETRCIHDLIVERCQATPDAIAITSSHEQNMTYGELDYLTLQLAHRLVELGVGPEVFVLSCFEKSLWAIVARLAILRAGGAYIMVDARNPPIYLESIVRRANTKVMLTAPKFSPQFQNLVPTVIQISRETIRALPVHFLPPVVNVTASNACLILFTSGSTGHPKGIIQTHQSYGTAIRDYAQMLDMGPKSRLLQFDDYTFDISNNDYFAPLMTGGTCCVPRPCCTIPQLVREINETGATSTFLTPTVAIQLPPELVPSIKLLCVGGEAMSKDLLTKWSGKAKIINQYGMGEVATFCSYDDKPTPENASSIGRPGCNTIWLVSLASPERLVPVGAAGEVLIEGPNVARGYLDPLVRPTGARFLSSAPSWFESLHPGRKASSFYLSGDLARYTHEGTLEYVGRKDLMLKLDGCRIDAIEVEHCARASLHAEDAIIVDLLGTVAENASPVLTAYLYLHDHPLANTSAIGGTVFLPSSSCAVASTKAGEIEAALRAVLPYHMVPTKFLIVSRIPKTGSRKTDRKKLHAEAEFYHSHNIEV